MPHSKLKRLANGAPLALVLAALTGCDSSVAPEAPQAIRRSEAAAAPRVVDGRLVFESPEQLESHLKPMIDAPVVDLVAREQRTAGFESLRAYVDGGEWSEETSRVDPGDETPTGNEAKALEADGVTREDFPMGDAFLAVLNSRGQVQVGDTVFKLTRDNTYRAHVNDLALLDEQVPTLSSPAPADPDDRIQVAPVETTVPRSGDTDEARLLNTDTCTPTVGSARMRAASYITNAVWYSEAGVNTTWQRRKRVGFVSFWANTWQSGTLSHKWTAYLRQGHFLMPLAVVYDRSDSQSEPGTDRIHRTLAWGFNHRIRGWIETDHSVANSILNTTCHTSARA